MLRLVVGGAEAGGRWCSGWWWVVLRLVVGGAQAAVGGAQAAVGEVQAGGRELSRCAVHFVLDVQTECLLSVISVLVKEYSGAIYLEKASIALG